MCLWLEPRLHQHSKPSTSPVTASVPLSPCELDLLTVKVAPFRLFQRFFGQPAHFHHKQSILRYLFPQAVRQRYRERLLDFRLETVPYYKQRLQSRIYRYILARQHRRLAKTRWVDRIATAAQKSHRLLVGPPPYARSQSKPARHHSHHHKRTYGQRRGDGVSGKQLEDASDRNSSSSSSSSTIMSQWSGSGGYGLGPGSGDPYGSREPGARRKKLAALAKNVYNAGVATAGEIRNQYDNTRIRGVVDMDDSTYKVTIPGSFPDVAIVTKGQEEMVLFPSYAKRHIREFRDDGSKISSYVVGDQREGALSDEDYWRNEWARAEDKKAVVDVDVRGWVYSPHRGPMTRRNRVLIGLARRLSGIPAPTHQAAGQLQDLHTSHEEREEVREQEKIAKEAEEIERRGQAEKEAAVRGGYSEAPRDDDSDGEGTISPSKHRSGSHTPASGPPSPGLSGRSNTFGAAASTELTEAELAMANANLMARLGPFLTTPLIQRPVTLFFYNDNQSKSRTVETNDAGHFSLRAGLDFVPTHVRVIANEDLSAVQEIEVTSDEGVSIISDIDDTIKKSSISLGAREIFRNTFIRDLKDLSVDGVKEWYGELHKMGVRFHYCSNSPWQLFPVIATFFRHADLPPGSLHLKQYSGMLQGIFEPVAERKKGTLEKILRDFPKRKFILVGDSGEADLEVYTDLAVANPGRILAVFIRDVTTPEQPGYFDTAVNGLPSRSTSKDDSRKDEATRRPTLPPRMLSEPAKLEGPAMGTLIDFSDEPQSMDAKEEKNLEQMQGGTGDLASLALLGKKPPPPRPNKPAALKGESSGLPNKSERDSAKPGPPVSSKKPVTTQIKNALPHPLTQMQNTSQQSIRSNSGQTPNNSSGSANDASSTTSSKISSRTASPGSTATSSTKQAPPPPPPRRRVTPLVKLSPRLSPRSSPRSRALRPSNSNPDIEKLDLNATPSSSISSFDIRPPPGRTNTATTFDSMLGPSAGNTYQAQQQGQYNAVNKKLELWRRRLERAHDRLDREGVRLYTWRRGQDVVLEAVGLVRETLEKGLEKKQ